MENFNLKKYLKNNKLLINEIESGDVVTYKGEDHTVQRIEDDDLGVRVYIRPNEKSYYGGRKDTFWVKPEDLKEDMNDPVLVKARAAKMAAEKEKAKQSTLNKKYGSSFMDKLDAEISLKQELQDLKNERAQLMIDMEQEAEPEGGEIADRYGSRLNDIDAKMAEIKSELDDLRMYESVEESVKMPSQEEVDNFFSTTQNEMHYLNSKPVMGQKGDRVRSEIEPWDEYDLSNWNALVRKAKAQGKINEGKKTNLTSLLREATNYDTVSTEHLDAYIYKDGGVKLRINSSTKSPYGYTKRELIKSPFGVEDEEFTFDYIKNEIDEVYTKFPDEEIKELLDKVAKQRKSINEDIQPLAVEKLTDEALLSVLNNIHNDTGKYTRAKSELARDVVDELTKRKIKIHYVDNERYEFMNENEEFEYKAPKDTDGDDITIDPDTEFKVDLKHLVQKHKVNEDKYLKNQDSYIRVTEPRFRKDKNNPNFLYGYINYDTGPGVSIALGKETMAGQIKRLSSMEAVRRMKAIAVQLEDAFNIEDIEVTDLENGVVELFAVSDDFIDIDPKSELSTALLNEEFKKGDKVTYLGNPGEITFVGKDQMGRTYYSVSYDKGYGKTKASNLYNKGGEIKAVNELELDVTDSGNPETTGDEAIERESASPAFESKLTTIYKSIKK